MKELLKIVLYKPLYNLLIFLAWLVPGHSIGWAIVAITFLVRLALLPSSIKTTKSQQKMKLLSPALQEIKEKFKGDRQGEAQATMSLYKKHGVSPWGSCLPLLIQLPILIILYRVFMVGLNADRFDLLYSFTPHLNSINTWFLGVDLSQPNKYVFPIIAGLSQLVQSWQMKKMNPTPQTAKKDDFSNILTGQMMYMMPLFTVFIAMRLPAALSLYWIVTTLFMVIQTWWTTKQFKVEGLKLKGEEAQEDLSELGDTEKIKLLKEAEKEEEPQKKMSLAQRFVKMRQPKPRKDVSVEIRTKK